MKCNICGKEFEVGNRADGIPNGMGFVLQDGRQITVCADCMMDMNKLKPFIDSVKDDTQTDCAWK